MSPCCSSRAMCRTQGPPAGICVKADGSHPTVPRRSRKELIFGATNGVECNEIGEVGVFVFGEGHQLSAQALQALVSLPHCSFSLGQQGEPRCLFVWFPSLSPGPRAFSWVHPVSKELPVAFTVTLWGDEGPFGQDKTCRRAI